MAKSPEVPVVFDLPVSLGGWKSLLVIAADQLASRVELIHPNCMDGLLVASGNRSPNLWCMKLSRTGGTTICCVRFLGNRLLIGWSNSSIRTPYGSIKF